MNSIKNNIATLLFATIFLVGCITPRYESTSQESVSNDIYRNVNTSDTTTLADIKWEDYYSDNDLKVLIHEAIDSNLNLRGAVTRIEQARQYFKQRRSAIAPSISAGANFSMADLSKNGSSNIGGLITDPVEQYSFALNASWEIDVWGKLRSSKKAAYARLLQQVATKNSIITQLISDVASSYYQLLILDAQLGITEKTIQNYTSYLETVSALKDAGQINEVAVQQAKAQLYGAKAMLPQLKSSIGITENFICMLLSKTPQTIKRAGSVSINDIAFDAKVGVPYQMLSNRPDVIAAENALRASHWSFNQARASLYPALTIGGQAGFEAMEAKAWFDPNSMFWSFVGGLTQPIFNGRALRTNRNVAELQKEETMLMFKSVLISSGIEVSNSVSLINATTEKALAQKEQVAALANAYEYSQMLFTRGYATYLDVLVAQTGLFSSELNLYQSYFDVLKYKIELYRALGGGWKAQ